MAQLIPLFRCSRTGAVADHIFTTARSEYDHACARDHIGEGIVGYVFDGPVPGAEPLYRLKLAGGSHYYTVDTEEFRDLRESGLVREASCEGYVHGRAAAGAVAFYRLSGIGTHLCTSSAAERDAAIASGSYFWDGYAGFIHTEPAAITQEAA